MRWNQSGSFWIYGTPSLLSLLLLHCQMIASQPGFGPEVELDTLNCPKGCACQYAAFSELPIARWVTHMTGNNADETEDGFFGQTYTKLGTCLLQVQDDAEALLDALPMDLQALILLYTGGAGHELTVNTSSLKQLNQLTTLEIRGSAGAGSLYLIIDEPLEFLQHANFEQLMLIGSDKLQRPKYLELPSDHYEYRPRGEVMMLDETDGAMAMVGKQELKYQLEFETANDVEQVQVEIMPYEEWVQLIKQTRMPTFYGWTHLEVLRAHNCQLSELHWQMFDGLAALQHLSLEHNSIESLPPFALYGALHIKTLSLAHNFLQRLHYRALAGLLELETLDLRANRLERLSELSFPPLPLLQRADFRHNPVRYIFPATFWVMNDTRELHFDSTEVAMELWTNNPFDSLRKLRTLTLGNVSINSLEQGVFKGLISLETLTMRGEVRNVEFDAFAGLGRLRELDLSYCGIRQLSMDALLGCKRLQLLRLAHNNLTYLPPGLLDDLQLEEIYLQGNQLRTLPTSFFLQTRLLVARLNDNPWECSCDMSNWLARITNAVRGRPVEQCVTDFMTGQVMSCRRVHSLEMDKSLAPRCANFNGRSVYYVRRKDLRCGEIRFLRHTKTKPSLPHWRKVEQMQQKRQQNPKQGKQQKLKINPNSLEYGLTPPQLANRPDLNLSNEI